MLAFLLHAAVVVELFTSQGCSSCPPADALISELSKKPGQVIPLAFHVDYWDNAFWRDPFSSHEWTERQMMYARTFKLSSAYTPQMVVSGTKQFVGSNAAAMNAAVGDAARAKPAGTISVEAKRDGRNIDAVVHADPPPNSDVVLVVFQNGVSTKIAGGENSGRAATDDAIVRKMIRGRTGMVMIPIDPAWKHVGVAAFLQDRNTRAITAATSVLTQP